MRYEIRELGLGEILDQAVTLTKNHFGLFITILVVLQIPFGLLVNFGMLAVMPAPPVNPTPQEALAFQQEVFRSILPIYPLILIGALIVLPLTNAALIHAIAAQYLQKPVSVGSSFSRAFKIILPVIGTWILVYLAVLGGLILCIIPGIIFAFWFTLATQVVVIEGTGGVAALKRSKALMQGNIGTFFVLALLLGAINIGLSFAAELIPQPQVKVILAVLVQAVLTIFGSAALVVFYFSCRCKHENFDLTLLAQAVGEQPPDTSGGFQG